MMADARVILLVEDDPKDEELTLFALRKSKVLNDVVVVRDGAEALDYLFAQGAYSVRNPSDFPAVVLLDLMLPKINGLEVLRRIRADKSTERLPVVIFTSSNEERDLLEAYSSGCNSYVRKPVDFMQFSESVRQVGLYWLVVNERAPKPNQGA